MAAQSDNQVSYTMANLNGKQWYLQRYKLEYFVTRSFVFPVQLTKLRLIYFEVGVQFNFLGEMVNIKKSS